MEIMLYAVALAPSTQVAIEDDLLEAPGRCNTICDEPEGRKNYPRRQHIAGSNEVTVDMLDE
jgi:hypothetical protein